MDSECVEVGGMDLGQHLSAFLAAQKLLLVPVGQPPILLLAGQVLLEAGEESIPGLLGGVRELVHLLELLKLLRVKIRVARHPGSDNS